MKRRKKRKLARYKRTTKSSILLRKLTEKNRREGLSKSEMDKLQRILDSHVKGYLD